MNLGEFHTEVGEELTRGSKYTSRIPQRVRDAGFWIERNYTQQYQKPFKEFTIAADDAKRTISLPAGTLTKRIEFLRIVKASTLTGQDSRFTYLSGPVHPKDVTVIRNGEPSCFWLDADQFLWLDAFPSEDTNFEIYYEVLTDWNNLATTDEPWLINYAHDVVLAKTMLLLLPTAWQAKRRKDEYREMLQEGLKVLIDASQELQYGGAEAQMQFVPKFRSTAT